MRQIGSFSLKQHPLHRRQIRRLLKITKLYTFLSPNYINIYSFVYKRRVGRTVDEGEGVAEGPAENKCLLESLTVWNAPRRESPFPNSSVSRETGFSLLLEALSCR